jgi:hypothetical protein
MDVFSGGGDTLTSGQQYLIQVKLVLRLSPALAAVSAPDVGYGGWNTEGDIVLNTIGDSVSSSSYAFAKVDSSNGTTGGSFGALEPCMVEDQLGRNQITFATANFTLGTAATATPLADVTGVTKNSSKSAYVDGTFTLTHAAGLSVSEGNGSIYGLTKVGSSGGAFRCISVKFDTPQTKDNTHTVSAYFRYSWQRRFA